MLAPYRKARGDEFQNRSLVSRAFTLRRMQEMRPRVRELARDHMLGRAAHRLAVNALGLGVGEIPESLEAADEVLLDFDAAILANIGNHFVLVLETAHQSCRTAIHEALRQTLVQGIGEGVLDGLLQGVAVDVVTWPPTSAARRRRRGYDQAELAARALAGHLGRPARSLLRREAGPPQTGRSAADRRHGPRFTARRGAAAQVAGARVLLVDDVVTTGATLRAAARILAELGADEVHGLALARTPAPGTAEVGRSREGAGRLTVLKGPGGWSDTRREAGGGSSLTVDGRDATD